MLYLHGEQPYTDCSALMLYHDWPSVSRVFLTRLNRSVSQTVMWSFDLICIQKQLFNCVFLA